MARKNILTIAADPDDEVIEQPTESADRAGIQSPAFASLRDSVRELENSSVKEIDLSQIISEGPRDRIAESSEGIQELAEAIRKHGQHVPIMVRPAPGHAGKFEIVYGRRRLAAIRLIGGDLRIKAIVRSLDDDEAVITQGQENNLRLDPTFIERALFAQELRRQGFNTQIILDALNIEKTSLSKMESIIGDLPDELVTLVGAARDIGRRQWRELADFGVQGIDVLDVGQAALKLMGPDATSSQRFEAVLKAVRFEASSAADAALQRRAPTPAVRKLGRQGPAPQMALSQTKRTISLTLQIRENPNFSDWLLQNAEDVVRDLQDKWIQASRSQD